MAWTHLEVSISYEVKYNHATIDKPREAKSQGGLQDLPGKNK